MTVRPDDLANLCALFSELGKRAISLADLRRAASNALPLDADASSQQIIEEARTLGLVAARRNIYHITKLGRQVGKQQGTPKIAISEGATSILVDAIYLNPHASRANCAALLTAFRPDAEAGTFVHDREPDETTETQPASASRPGERPTLLSLRPSGQGPDDRGFGRGLRSDVGLAFPRLKRRGPMEAAPPRSRTPEARHVL